MPLQKGEPLSHIAETIDVVQRQYKDAETIICEFMAVQTYDEENPPSYRDFTLQELHDFIADKIEALDPNYNRYQGKRGQYQIRKE